MIRACETAQNSQTCLQFDDSFKPKLAPPPVREEKQVKVKDAKKDTPEWLQKRQMSSATYQIRKQVRLCCDRKVRVCSTPQIGLVSYNHLTSLFISPSANTTPNSDVVFD